MRGLKPYYWYINFPEKRKERCLFSINTYNIHVNVTNFGFPLSVFKEWISKIKTEVYLKLDVTMLYLEITSSEK